MQIDNLEIRQAVWRDLPEILNIYEIARCFMAANGNAGQWGTEHPKEEILREDMAQGRLYAVTKHEKICGVFALISGVDPTYTRIDGGNWHKEKPYLTIHRIAGNGTARGIFAACLEFAKQRSSYLRIDTHEKNGVMRHLLEKNGFRYCGIIYVRDGSPRIAYDYSVESTDLSG